MVYVRNYGEYHRKNNVEMDQLCDCYCHHFLEERYYSYYYYQWKMIILSLVADDAYQLLSQIRVR